MTVDAPRADASDRFRKEHNFVFRRGDIYLHGNGATPAWSDYAADATGLTLIPLSMSEPVLVVRGNDAATSLSSFVDESEREDGSKSEVRKPTNTVSRHDQRKGDRTQQISARKNAVLLSGLTPPPLPMRHEPQYLKTVPVRPVRSALTELSRRSKRHRMENPMIIAQRWWLPV